MAMPSSKIREVLAADRPSEVRYAIRDLAVLADEVASQGRTSCPSTSAIRCNSTFALRPN